MVAVGIDLGTTRSAVAVIEGGQPRIISSSSGSRLTPSVVAMDKESNILVGAPAARQEAVNPAGTVRSIKRRMGQKLPLQLPGGMYTPEEISGWILAQLKADAEAYLEIPVTDAVITVPAYFNDAQRHATAEAGALAGLNVLRIVNEPTAAALAYGLDKEHSATILVFDLGGGTFDVSLLTVGDGVVEVRATAGNNHLGGDDWDQAIVRWVIKKLEVEDLDLHAMIRVREAAETAKIALSDAPSTIITLPYLETPDGLKNFNEELTRAEFEKITAPLLEQVAEPMSAVMRDSELTYEEIDKVILVGGATRMPAVSSTVAKLTGIKPSKAVDPDEAVALGAAIQAGILAGTVKDILLLDVTAMSLGVATQGGLMAKIIERNTTIPTTQTETFTTVTDNQSTVRIDVYQGESDLADSNTKLATFELVGIPNAPRGVPQIDVTFDITANGMVEVSAKDRVSGLSRAIVVGPSQSSATVSEHQLKTDRLRAEAIKSTQEQEEMIRYINKLLEEKRLPAKAVEAATIILKDLQGTDPSSVSAKKMMETLRTLAAETIDPEAEEETENS